MPAKKKDVTELQAQYDEMARQCSILSKNLSASEHNRIRQGGTVKLSEDGQAFKDLLALKQVAFKELQEAKNELRAAEERKLDEARRVLEAAGRIPARSETHIPETVLQEA